MFQKFVPPRRIAKISKEILAPNPSDDAKMNPRHLYLYTSNEFDLDTWPYISP